MGDGVADRRRRWLWAGIGLLVAVGLVVGTWFLASLFQSPAQREAAAEPPAQTPIVAEVTAGDLVEEITMKAAASLSGGRSVVLPAGEGARVVTAGGVAAGEELRAGSVVLWANGSPMFALSGTFPMYRDLGVGDSGQDVVMIQQALAALGYDISADGDFGEATVWCVKDLYESVGAQAPTRESNEHGDTAQSGESKAKTPKKEAYMPMGDFLTIAGLPAQVTSVPAVGSSLTEDNATLGLASSKAALTATVPGSVAVRITEGLEGTATLDDTTIDVKVSEVKDASSDKNEASSGESVISFVGISQELPTQWSGHEDVLVAVNLTPPIEDALLVPERAIATNSQGIDSVLVQTDSGEFVETTVQRTTCVSGVCAIDPAPGISEGTSVRVDR